MSLISSSMNSALPFQPLPPSTPCEFEFTFFEFCFFVINFVNSSLTASTTPLPSDTGLFYFT
jgi:hypothetical protein